MQHVVQGTPKRVCRFESTGRPIILYTDASDVPHRDPRFGLGGVLILQDPIFKMEFFSCSPSPDLLTSWLPRENFAGQLEILAGPTALSTWSHLLKGNQVIHFIDNDSAAANLVRGYSPKADSSALVGEYWLIAARPGIDIYIDRVESKSNVADCPSRFDLHAMQLYNVRMYSLACHTLAFHLLFLYMGMALDTRLCSFNVTHSQRRGEREVTIDGVGKQTSLAPSGCMSENCPISYQSVTLSRLRGRGTLLS